MKRIFNLYTTLSILIFLLILMTTGCSSIKDTIENVVPTIEFSIRIGLQPNAETTPEKDKTENGNDTSDSR